MKSMTGYGSSEYQDKNITATMEIKAYNNRFLDIAVNIPPYLNQLENQIRQYITGRVSRGRVEIFLKIIELQEDVKITIDKKVANAYVHAFRELLSATNLQEKIHLAHLLRVDGVLKAEKNYNIDEYKSVLEALISKAFREFDRSRIEEGKNLKQELLNILARIKQYVKEISSHAKEIEKKIKENLRKRFFELLGNAIDENRILAETALLLIKFDINEELARMDSHIKSFSSILKNEDVVGKKLDFLCQELNREVNTISAKSMIIDINQTIVQLKSSIEQLREQLRNVE